MFVEHDVLPPGFYDRAEKYSASLYETRLVQSATVAKDQSVDTFVTEWASCLVGEAMTCLSITFGRQRAVAMLKAMLDANLTHAGPISRKIRN